MKIRPRRNRNSEAIRSLVRENNVTVNDLVYPLFIVEGKGLKEEIASLPGNYRFSLDNLLKEIKDCMSYGLNTFILFPAIPESYKNSTGDYSYDANNFYLQAIKKIKTQFPTCCIITDVALDPYNSDGHDGIVSNGVILNDETLPILGKMAVAQAKNGADIIGPSDMMDGRIEYIRNALDTAGLTSTPIMSYSVKYASAFYGPFRDALDSAPKAGDKKSYQMDPGNSNEAEREALLDVSEGADYLIIKPALHYLDVIQRIKETVNIPIVAYHVSGEYAMLHAACQNGWLELKKALPEVLLCMKRAGSDIIITYYAKEYAKILSKKN